MAKPPELLNITVTDKGALGNQWKLTISGKTIAGGYAKNLWAALDDTNDALGSYVRRTVLENGE